MIPIRPPRATFNQLRTFEAVARLGGMSRAAFELHLSQPTVSAQIRELSSSLGLELVVSSGRGVRLTEEGRALQAVARDLFERWHQFEETVDSLRGLHRGVLRIAGVTTAEYFIARMLKPFAVSYPGVRIDLSVENRDRVIERISRELDDVAVMMLPPSQLPLECLPFMDNPLVVIGPVGHPWATRRRIALAELALESLLMREPGSGTRQAALEWFEQRGIQPDIRMTLGSNEAIKHAVAAGLGLAVLSRHTLADEPQHEGLAVLAVAGFPIRRQWQLVWRRDRPLPRAAAAFIDYVRQAAITSRTPDGAPRSRR